MNKATHLLIAMSVVTSMTALRTSQLRAQDTPAVSPSEYSLGGTIAVAEYLSDAGLSLIIVGFQAAQLRPGRLGGDFHFGTMPRLLFEGIVPLVARGGLVLPVSASEKVALLPSGGVTTIGFVGTGSSQFTVGLNVGMGLLLGDRDRLRFRPGVTWHFLSGAGTPIWLAELGVLLPTARD